MSDWVYNTDHSNFHMSLAAATAAYDTLRPFVLEDGKLSEYLTEEDWDKIKDFTTLAAALSLNVSTDLEETCIVDISLEGSHYDEELEGRFFKALAPFVTPGSFLVFYGGGSEGCWALNFDLNILTGKVDMVEMDLTAVLQHDLVTMLLALREAKAPCFEKMRLKYCSELEKE